MSFLLMKKIVKKIEDVFEKDTHTHIRWQQSNIMSFNAIHNCQMAPLSVNRKWDD